MISVINWPSGTLWTLYPLFTFPPCSCRETARCNKPLLISCQQHLKSISKLFVGLLCRRIDGEGVFEKNDDSPCQTVSQCGFCWNCLTRLELVFKTDHSSLSIIVLFSFVFCLFEDILLDNFQDTRQLPFGSLNLQTRSLCMGLFVK